VVSVFLIIIGFLSILIGIAGCFLPVIPGPVVAYLSLIFIDLARDGQAFSLTFLLIMGTVALLLSILLDYLVSMAGARKYGASRAGVWGSVAGMIIGVFFFPPLGIFIGALMGGVICELFAGKKTEDAIRVGWGIFVGNLAGIVIKFAYCLMILFFFVKALF
jgi:uncharacterized protein YqgC (DUF456 family)